MVKTTSGELKTLSFIPKPQSRCSTDGDSKSTKPRRLTSTRGKGLGMASHFLLPLTSMWSTPKEVSETVPRLLGTSNRPAMTFLNRHLKRHRALGLCVFMLVCGVSTAQQDLQMSLSFVVDVHQPCRLRDERRLQGDQPDAVAMAWVGWRSQNTSRDGRRSVFQRVWRFRLCADARPGWVEVVHFSHFFWGSAPFPFLRNTGSRSGCAAVYVGTALTSVAFAFTTPQTSHLPPTSGAGRPTLVLLG